MPTIKGYWAKAWDGYLAHFWVGDRETLCGKTHMLPHSHRGWHTRARSTCKKCQKRHAALLAKQAGSLTQPTKKGETQCSS